jgi:hypothetical protein
VDGGKPLGQGRNDSPAGVFSRCYGKAVMVGVAGLGSGVWLGGRMQDGVDNRVAIASTVSR